MNLKQILSSVLASLLITLLPLIATAQENTWVTDITGNSAEVVEDLVVDADGNIYITGFFQDTIEFGGTAYVSRGQSDIFLAKYDSSGAVQWAHTYGWEANDFAHDLTLDGNGNLYMIGDYQDSTLIGTDTLFTEDSLWFGAYALTYNIMLAKFDTDGNYMGYAEDGWFGSDFAYAMDVDGSGNAYVTGVFRSFLEMGPKRGPYAMGYDDAFLVKIDTGMNFIWSRGTGSTQYDRGMGVSVYNENEVYLVGNYQETMWYEDTTYSILSQSPGEDDIFIAVWDSSGSFLWAKGLGGPGMDKMEEMIMDDQGNMYFTGTFTEKMTLGPITLTSAGNHDMFLMKTDRFGNVIWATSGGGPEFDAGVGLALSPNGKVVVTGYYQGSANFGPVVMTTPDGFNQEAFVAAYNSADGLPLWVNKAGGLSKDGGRKVGMDSRDWVYVSGTFNDTAWFGQEYLTAMGAENLFLMRLDDIGRVSVDPGQQDMNGLGSLSVYPNPTEGYVNFQLELEDRANVELQIIDIRGSKVGDLGQRHSLSVGSHRLSADLENLPAGLYFYRLIVNDHIQSGKIVLR